MWNCHYFQHTTARSAFTCLIFQKKNKKLPKTLLVNLYYGHKTSRRSSLFQSVFLLVEVLIKWVKGLRTEQVRNRTEQAPERQVSMMWEVFKAFTCNGIVNGGNSALESLEVKKHAKNMGSLTLHFQIPIYRTTALSNLSSTTAMRNFSKSLLSWLCGKNKRSMLERWGNAMANWSSNIFSAYCVVKCFKAEHLCYATVSWSSGVHCSILDSTFDKTGSLVQYTVLQRHCKPSWVHPSPQHMVTSCMYL